MKSERKIFVIFLLIIFFIGILFCLNPNVNRENLTTILNQETLEQVKANSCPDVLINYGNEIHLLDRQKPRDSLNPIIFKNLEEYKTYIVKQRENGIYCPILYLQEENNTQGQTVYRMRPSPDNLLPAVNTIPVNILDSSRDNPPYNKGMFSGFDPHGQHVGEYTELDKIHDSTKKALTSDNPMDTNWGGVYFSQAAVDSGKYAGREVGKPKLVPKVMEIYK